MIVVDANVLIYELVGEEPRAEETDVLAEAEPDWSAPLLIMSELRNALTTLYRQERIVLSEAQELVREAEQMIGASLFEVSSEEVLELVGRSDRSAYDCEYVALARRLEVPLLTYDQAVQADFPEIATAPTDYLGS